MALDELEIIERYFANLTPRPQDVVHGIGDDAAVMEVPPGFQLAASTDSLVEGVHFFPGADPGDVGYKSLAVNLSDMAATGAEPRWVLLSLVMPGAEESWLQRFAGGFGTLAADCGLALVGGDLSRGPLSITVQILGIVPAGEAISRRKARAGDDIYVTGELGGAGLALHLLRGGSPEVPDACLERLYRPRPRLAMGRALRGLASAAIDISDGLFLDLQRLAGASGVGARVELECVPLCPLVARHVAADDRWRVALGAGDDYELCFTVPAARASEVREAASATRTAVTRVGGIGEGSGVAWKLPDGSEVDPAGGGYRHF